MYESGDMGTRRRLNRLEPSFCKSFHNYTVIFYSI